MLPVSGALQLKISARNSLRPITSASGAYSSVLSPAPSAASGRNRFHNPAARARDFHSSIGAGTCQAFQSAPALAAFARRYSCSRGATCSAMNACIRCR